MYTEYEYLVNEKDAEIEELKNQTVHDNSKEEKSDQDQTEN
jgi:hypothetical protein